MTPVTNHVGMGASAAATPGCRVSVVIKAMNEERLIAAAIESALVGVSSVGGEVILADSGSSDRTISLALTYPIRIAQLADHNERSCGIGPQLGYQHSVGEFIYIMDGDMELIAGFLKQAIAMLIARPDLAGVGGRMFELNTQSLEYVSREARANWSEVAKIVDRLDCGGLYRRSAIESVGYFSDRNLHSYEEFDLASRLRSQGWNLMRLPQGAVTHFGHDAPPYSLLLRRWQSRYVCGLGELIRASFGQKRLALVLTSVRELRLYLAVIGWWCVLASSFFWPVSLATRLTGFVVVLAIPFVAMIWRTRSVALAVHAVVSWCFQAAGLLLGLLRPQRSPTDRISSRVLREPGITLGREEHAASHYAPQANFRAAESLKT